VLGTPDEMWSDKETLHDFLGFSTYVEVLADICTQGSLAPLTLGIFGPWGSGKTSLMSMLQRRLSDQAGTGGVKTIWFNAWRYEGRDEAQSALIHAIIAKLEEDKSIGQDVLDTLKQLKSSASVLKLAKVITKTALTLSPDIEGFFSAFEKQNEKVADTIERFDQQFADVLRNAKISHLVVFIDDLDRCSSEKVIETFETIKLFLNTPACTFVIGADPRKIEDAVGEVYKVTEDNRKRDFLEKIIQIPFVIPEQKIDDVVCYVGLLILAGYMQQGSWTELMKSRAAFLTSTDGIEKTLRAWPAQNRALFSEIAAVESELDEIFPYVRNLFHALRGNPRQIKRFLNILSLRRRLAKANNLVIHLQLLIKLAVLEYAWKDFFDSIVDTVDPLTGSCELFEEIAKASDGSAGEASGKLVTDALAQPALVHYLNREPVLKSTDDLRPYLFLAQTSLAKEKPEPVASLDEQAKRMARNIGSDDRMRARASARQAAAQDGETAALVVRILSQDLIQATNLTVQTHIVTGLIEICRHHPTQYVAATKALEKLTPPFAQALQIAGNTLISNARSAAVPITPALRESFAPKTKLASALAGKKKTSTKEDVH
jgi:GTPase SAR1 family protein